MIENKVRADATLRLGYEALLEGHQGQMVFSSMFMFDRFEIETVRCLLFIYNLH